MDVDKIAYDITEVWLLQRGFLPSVGWDSANPLCIRDYGPHRVYTIQAEVPSDYVGEFDRDRLRADFEAYLEMVNQALVTVRFLPYDVEVYSCFCHCGTFLYVSLVHTA